LPPSHYPDTMTPMAWHIIITGASSGLGRALALEFARRGANLGLIARRGELLATLADEVRELGVEASWAAADVVDEAQVGAAVTSLEEELGPCDVMIANAGISGRATPGHINVSTLREVMAVNYFGAANSAAAVIPNMRSRKSGQLVVVSSIAGFRGLPKSGAYCSSKAAISNLWESLRIELAPFGISCTTILPGYVETPLTDKNRHPMPFIITAADAAVIMVDGILANKSELVFPWQWRAVMAIVKRLPTWAYDWLMRRMNRMR
jgi:short-subunit dehydrogenase